MRLWTYSQAPRQRASATDGPPSEEFPYALYPTIDTRRKVKEGKKRGKSGLFSAAEISPLSLELMRLEANSSQQEIEGEWVVRMPSKASGRTTANSMNASSVSAISRRLMVMERAKIRGFKPARRRGSGSTS